MFGLNFRCLLQFYIFLFWYRYHSTIKAKQTNRDYEAAEKKKLKIVARIDKGVIENLHKCIKTRQTTAIQLKMVAHFIEIFLYVNRSSQCYIFDMSKKLSKTRKFLYTHKQTRRITKNEPHMALDKTSLWAI